MLWHRYRKLLTWYSKTTHLWHNSCGICTYFFVFICKYKSQVCLKLNKFTFLCFIWMRSNCFHFLNYAEEIGWPKGEKISTIFENNMIDLWYFMLWFILIIIFQLCFYLIYYITYFIKYLECLIYYLFTTILEIMPCTLPLSVLSVHFSKNRK